MFDSYTVKKVLPRLFAAVILIQLSWFLFTGVIKAVNLLAFGIEGLIYAPFGGISEQSLGDILSGVSGGSAGGLFSVVAAGTGVVIAAIALGGVLMTAGIVLLGVLIAFALLLFRQVIIVGLLIVAPLALVAWVLPSTEKYWKLWWDSFFKLLLVYPIILGMIAIGRVMASVVSGVDPGAQSWTIASDIVTFALVIACVIGPFFLIPKTFQMAGGIFQTLTGTINNKGSGAFDRMRKRRSQTMGEKGERTGRRITSKRAQWYQKQMGKADTSSTRGGAWARRLAARGAGGYNIEAKASAVQAHVAKELNDQIATGRDEEIRGLTVNKATANASRLGEVGETGEDVLRRKTKDGGVEYKTLGGGWASEAQVDAGHKRWGNDRFAQQAALSYEMRKALTEEDANGISRRYNDMVGQGPGGWGQSATEAKGTWKGAGFENQNARLEWKHTNTAGELDHAAFVEEVHQKKGTYPLSQMGSTTIDKLTEAYNAEGTSEDTKRKIREISETFVHEMGVGGQVGEAGEGIPVTDADLGVAGGAGGRKQVSAPGSAAVEKSAKELAFTTGAMPRPPEPTAPPEPEPPLEFPPGTRV